MKGAWLLFIWTLLVAVGNASVLLTAENPWEGAVVVQQTPVLARDCSVSSTWDLWVKPSFWPPTSTTYFLSQSAEGESLDTNYLVAVRYTYLTQHTTHTHTHTTSSHHPHSPYTDHTYEQTYKTLPRFSLPPLFAELAGFFDQFIRNFFSDVVPQYPHILPVPPFPIHARLSPFHTHNTHVVYVYSLCSTCLNVVYVFISPPHLLFVLCDVVWRRKGKNRFRKMILVNKKKQSFALPPPPSSLLFRPFFLPETNKN